MKKRNFTLMLSVLLVFGLVVCGNKQEEKPAGNTESEPAASVQSEENRQLGEYMLLKTQYVFFNFSEPLFLFIMDYIAIMLMSAFGGYYLLTILNGKKQKA